MSNNICSRGHVFDSHQPICLLCLNLANAETEKLVQEEKDRTRICKACDTKEVIHICPGNVAQQPHYTQWKIQPITFITANKLNFCQGNVVKYVMRYNQKNGLEDLKKAKVYIDYLIQELETGEVKP